MAQSFAFTSHNREYRHAQRPPKLNHSRNPVTQALHVASWARQVVNHARVGRLRRIEPEYALLNDSGHEFACLHYYIDQDTQRRQLANSGFQVVDVLDYEGRSLSPSDPTRESPWLMYVATRAA